MSAINGVRLNYRGVQQVLRAPGVREELLRRMQRVADQANRTGPSGVTHRAYEDSRPDAHLPAVRVGSDEWAALYEEARSGYLSASLDSAGGRPL